MRQYTAHRSAGGFTLLEVLVALAVLAIALGALVKAAADQADVVTHLRTRTFAQWVAADRMARLRLRDDWPEVGRSRGVTHMGRRDWYWTMKVSATREPSIRRVDIRVYKTPRTEHSLVRLSGFFGRY